MLLLQCPKCGNRMRYQENLNSPHKASNIATKSKKCVYCGKTFKIQGRIVKEVQRSPQNEEIFTSF